MTASGRWRTLPLDARFVDLGSPREQFPRDGRASAAAVQALLEVSSLIRNLPGRSRSRAGQYINHAYLERAGK